MGSEQDHRAVLQVIGAEIAGIARLNLVGENSSRYSVTRDGKRFVAIVSGQDSSPPLVLVQNWTMKLKQ